MNPPDYVGFDSLLTPEEKEVRAKVRIGDNPGNTTNVLSKERKIPVLLMEQRISAGKKLGRQPTVADRILFGQKLIALMAETVLR